MEQEMLGKMFSLTAVRKFYTMELGVEGQPLKSASGNMRLGSAPDERNAERGSHAHATHSDVI